MMIKKYADQITAYGLVAVIACAALMQGAVEAWSLALVELALLFLCAVWMVKSYAEKKLTFKVPATFYPLLALLVFGMLQCLSWTGENGIIKSLSFDPEATRAVVSVLIFLALGHLIAANFMAGASFKGAASLLTFFGFGLAVFSILQYFTWNGYFFWFIPAGPMASGGSVSGSFVNHNHFAGFMELIIPLPVAMLLTGAAKDKKLLYGFAAAIMTLAVVLSLSRGGMISLVCGLAITVAASLVYNHRIQDKEQALETRASGSRQWRQGLTFFAVVLILIGAVTAGTFWLGIDPLVNRVSNNEILSSDETAPTFQDSRGWIWGNTINIFRANSLTGTGLGSFETVYPNYSATDETSVVDRAHNDYLQILSDAGIIGGVLCVWFLGAVIYSAVRALRETNLQRAALAVGCMGGAMAMAVHSTFDFNLQLPSNALLLLALTGALAQIGAGVRVCSKSNAEEQVIRESDDELYAYGVSS